MEDFKYQLVYWSRIPNTGWQTRHYVAVEDAFHTLAEDGALEGFYDDNGQANVRLKPYFLTVL